MLQWSAVMGLEHFILFVACSKKSQMKDNIIQNSQKSTLQKVPVARGTRLTEGKVCS